MEENVRTPGSQSLKEQAQVLRANVVKTAISDIEGTIENFMSATYCAVFQSRKWAKKFLLPLMNIDRDENGKPKAQFATFERLEIVKKCRPETRARIMELAGCTDTMWEKAQKMALQRMADNVFGECMAHEIDTASDEEIRSFFSGHDVASWFKANTRTAAGQNYAETYRKLCDAIPGLKKARTSAGSWSDLCQKALNARNSRAHGTIETMEALYLKGIETAYASWLEVVEALHCDSINEAQYQQFQYVFSDSAKRMRRNLVPYDSLDVADGMSHAEIRSLLRETDIPCGQDCALYDSAEGLSDRLQRLKASYRWIPLSEIYSLVQDEFTETDCAGMIRQAGIRMEADKVFCNSEDQILAVLETARKLREQQEKLQEQQRLAEVREDEIENLRRELNLTREQVRELEKNSTFRAEVDRRVAARTLKGLPKLDQLCTCKGGKLTEEQLQELVSTHQLLLDPSVLRSEQGRQFLTKKLVPYLRILQESGRNVRMIVEATARLHLYQAFEAYHTEEWGYTAQEWTPDRERERLAAQQRMEELKSAGAAYLCMEDALHRQGFVRYVGIPHRDSTDEEALQVFLRQNPALRVCVLTCGASTLPAAITQEKYPLCVVARVQRELPLPGREPGLFCQIFPQYLPLVDGTEEDALLQTFQRCYQVSARDYLSEDIQEDILAAETEADSAGEEKAPAAQLQQDQAPQNDVEAELSASEPELSAGGEETPSAGHPEETKTDKEDNLKDMAPAGEPQEAAAQVAAGEPEGKMPAGGPEEAAAEQERKKPAAERRRLRELGQRAAFQPVFPPAEALRQVHSEELPITRSVEAGDTLMMETEQPVRLLSRLQEGHQNVEGGEGVLYCTDVPGQVAKIYHTEKRNYRLTSSRREKLEDMLAHNPNVAGVCWPTHLLYNQDRQFVGYLMPLAPAGSLTLQRSVMQIAKEAVRQELLPGWDRLDLAKVAQAVAAAVAQLHRNNILIGDINDGNFMVDPTDSSRIFLVDCDSYQFDGYPCPVGTMDYSHPNTAVRLGVTGDLNFGEFLRLEEEENYALAILLFRILMLGQHPFSTRGNMTTAQAMRERVFPYTADEVEDIPEGDSWMIWKNMPRKLTDAFLKTFREWDAPSASEWQELLGSYAYSIEKYGFTRELAPVKYHEFNPEKPFFQDVVCELDGLEFNMPIKKYEWLKRSGQHIFCQTCKHILQQFEKQPDQVHCDNCGKMFTGNAKQACLQEKLGEKYYCPACAAVRRICDGCGAEISVPRQESERYSKQIFCQECRKREPHTCDVCGKTYQVMRGTYRIVKKYGRAAICRECRDEKILHPTCCVCGEQLELENENQTIRSHYRAEQGFFCGKDLPSAWRSFRRK